jgi:hypothetical protein
MKRILRTFFIGLLAATLLAIVACATLLLLWRPRHSRVDQWLSSPCSPPCWFGITPGKTTKVQLSSLVTTLPYSDDPHAQTYWKGPWNEFSGIYTLYFTGGPRSTAQLDIWLIDGVVSEIAISGLHGYIQLNLTLQDALATYGPPDGLFPGHRSHGDFSSTTINLTYPKSGLLLILLYPTTHQPVLSPDDLIQDILIVDPSQYFQYLLAHESHDLNACARDWLIPWQGFGEVAFPSADHCPVPPGT